jgi:hypothetical protein
LRSTAVRQPPSHLHPLAIGAESRFCGSHRVPIGAESRYGDAEEVVLRALSGAVG